MFSFWHPHSANEAKVKPCSCCWRYIYRYLQILFLSTQPIYLEILKRRRFSVLTSSSGLVGGSKSSFVIELTSLSCANIVKYCPAQMILHIFLPACLPKYFHRGFLKIPRLNTMYLSIIMIRVHRNVCQDKIRPSVNYAKVQYLGILEEIDSFY